MGNLDVVVFQFFNKWAGTPMLDFLATFADRSDFFKGALSLACFWWFWFAQPRVRNRQIVIGTLIASSVSIFIARLIAFNVDFRARPMHTPGIDYHEPSISMSYNNQEDWSAFPSDHTAMWFALAFGLWKMSRPFGLLFMAYTIVWVCIPRLYMGVHYPSDLVVGAVIGIVTAAVVCAIPLTAKLSNFLMRIEEGWPKWFYTAAFLVTFEMAETFDDVRKVLHGLRLIFNH